MHFLSSITIVVLYSLACLGTGQLLISMLRGHFRERQQTSLASTGIASDFLTGLATLSTVLTMLGLMGWIKTWPVMLSLFPGLFGFIIHHITVISWLRSLWQGFLHTLHLPLQWLLVALTTTLLVLACALGAWTLQPIGDAAAFYMAYPKIIAATGLLEPMPGPMYLFSTIGLSIELHYAALMVLADANAAKLLMFPVALCTLAMLNAIVRACGGRTLACLVSAAMLFSSYTFYFYSFDGKVDIVAAAFGLAAVYWLLQALITNLSKTYLMLAGWFAGLATMAKFSYIPTLGICMLTLIIWHLATRQRQHPLRPVHQSVSTFLKLSFILAGVAVIAWIPQLIKNGALFAAPFAPFLGMPDKGWLDQTWFSPEVTHRILLSYPFALVYGRYPMQGGGLSFLFIAFLPFLYWLRSKIDWQKSLTAAITLSAIAALIVWMALRPSVIAPRYILATLLLFIPILAIAVETAMEQAHRSQLLQAAVCATMLSAIAVSFWHLLPVPAALASHLRHQNTECLLASQECPLQQKLNTIAQAGERVFIDSYYPYWLDVPLLTCRDTSEEQQALRNSPQPLAWLAAHGFHYVFIDTTVDKKLATNLQTLMANNPGDLSLIDSQGTNLFLYKINSATTVNNRCVADSAGRWHLESIAQ